jgi:hypothetical protein
MGHAKPDCDKSFFKLFSCEPLEDQRDELCVSSEVFLLFVHFNIFKMLQIDKLLSEAKRYSQADVKKCKKALTVKQSGMHQNIQCGKATKSWTWSLKARFKAMPFFVHAKKQPRFAYTLDTFENHFALQLYRNHTTALKFESRLISKVNLKQILAL